MINHPLMLDNIDKQDIKAVVDFLQQDQIPKLTNGPKVLEFEQEWSKWLGVDYSLFVNSGASANELTMLALQHLYGDGEIIVPPLTWISDIAAVEFAGLTPVFVDINLTNLSFDIDKLKKAITPNTKAIFLTHVLGLNGITPELISICRARNIRLIEDVCESHGATYQGFKCGSIGYASNFSFYFAHHMSTIEGGMICTNDNEFYQVCRALRSHGMVREMTNDAEKSWYKNNYPDLNPDFIFIRPAHNYRSTEINAVIGLNQLPKLDINNSIRRDNFQLFLSRLDGSKYITDFNIDGQSNYAFIVILKSADFSLRNKVEQILTDNGIEFRRGLSGGGNQTLQPHARSKYKVDQQSMPNVNHVHNFGWYIGNYPSMQKSTIDKITDLLNGV